MTWSVFVVGAFACFRVTRLIVEDTVFDGPRDRFLQMLEPRMATSRMASFLYDLLGCQWCVGVHVAGWALLVAAVTGVVTFPVSSAGAVAFIGSWFGLAAAQSLLYRLSER